MKHLNVEAYNGARNPMHLTQTSRYSSRFSSAMCSPSQTLYTVRTTIYYSFFYLNKTAASNPIFHIVYSHFLAVLFFRVSGCPVRSFSSRRDLFRLCS